MGKKSFLTNIIYFLQINFFMFLCLFGIYNTFHKKTLMSFMSAKYLNWTCKITQPRYTSFTVLTFFVQISHGAHWGRHQRVVNTTPPEAAAGRKPLDHRKSIVNNIKSYGVSCGGLNSSGTVASISVVK